MSGCQSKHGCTFLYSSELARKTLAMQQPSELLLGLGLSPLHGGPKAFHQKIRSNCSQRFFTHRLGSKRSRRFCLVHPFQPTNTLSSSALMAKALLTVGTNEARPTKTRSEHRSKCLDLSSRTFDVFLAPYAIQTVSGQTPIFVIWENKP